ncbi:MAG: alpha/beta hydrolase [Clostridia bacterium]|nr:alpha/beta hydrolase [Clostridia bacterium]
MVKVKSFVPKNQRGEPLPQCFGEYIYFDIEFNFFRDVDRTPSAELRDRYEARVCECVLRLPESYSETGEPTQLVIFCHGAGGRVCESEGTIGGLSQTAELFECGFAVLDVHGSIPSGLSMGSPEHIQALFKAYKFAIRHYNLTDRVLIGGESMGGTTAMNFLNTYPSVVLAAGLFYPRLNIDSVTVDGHFCLGTWDKTAKRPDGISTRERVAENYRFGGGEWCEENTVGFNPYRTRSFINNEGKRVLMPPCPIKVWQGDADTVVDPVMVSEFVASIRRGGCYAELRMLDGVAHHSTPTMKRELALWFLRFV